ncbi:MAG TPA: ATP-binding protein [Kofleriaceae bacterium]|nr:ATP-binding protein [Kofleriaceae bacterium]
MAASLVPLAVAAVLDIRASRARLRHNVEDLLMAHADQLRQQIDAFHQGYLLSATELARLPTLISFLAAAPRPEVPASLREILELDVESDRNLAAIAVLDRDGRVVVASEPGLVGAVLDRAAVRGALDGERRISDVYVAEPALDNAPVIAYAVPVQDHRGVIGAVVLCSHAGAVWDIARGSNDLVGPGSYAVLLDGDGIRIGHTLADDLVFRPTGALPPARRAALLRERRFGDRTAGWLDDIAEFPEAFARAHAAFSDPRMFRTVAGSARAPHDWNYGVSRRITTVPWTLIYLLPVDALDDQIAVVTRDKLVLVGLIMVGAFAIGLLLASMILRPVETLSAATSRIASGDLSARVADEDDDDNDELGRLCASFNAMADRIERDAVELRRSRDELEDRVADRTGELVRASIAEARTREALQASAQRLEVLSRTSHELAAASGEVAAVLELTVRRLGEVIGDACTIRMISDDAAWLEPTRAFYHPDPELRAFALGALGPGGESRSPVGQGIGGQVAGTGEAVLLPSVALADVLPSVPSGFRAVLERMKLTSVLAVPLRSRDRTLGVVSLLRGAPGAPYTVDDQRFAQDVADRAGLAIDNAVLVETLERRVAARTAALETANRELEAFSYSVSHDLRAPLRTIDGFSDILLSDHGAKLDPDAQRCLQRIRVATQRMSGLIDDLLHLARITRVQLRWSPIDLAAIAQPIVAELVRREPGRATPVHVAPGLTGHADAKLMSIALENLLGNAWKFTAKQAAAEIWFGSEERDGERVFFVRDTGAGFDMKYADKLFLPFQRLHTADEFDGVGVGLATVQRIISHHGGRIWAEAALGAGATFFFVLGAPA